MAGPRGKRGARASDRPRRRGAAGGDPAAVAERGGRRADAGAGLASVAPAPRMSNKRIGPRSSSTTPTARDVLADHIRECVATEGRRGHGLSGAGRPTLHRPAERWISEPRRIPTHKAAIPPPNDRKAREPMSSRSTQTGKQDGDRMGGRPDRDRLADGRPGHARGVDVAEHDPARSGCLDRGSRVDGERLQPELRGVADHRRRARRPLRAPVLLRDRVGPVRRGVGGERAGAQRRRS